MKINNGFFIYRLCNGLKIFKKFVENFSRFKRKVSLFFLLGLNVHEEEEKSNSLANSVSIPSITGDIDVDYNTQEDNRPKKRRSVRNCFVLIYV